jgi:DNA-binding NtrC family response regulator
MAGMSGSILVVDDEPGIREAFDLVLGDAYELRLAGSAEEALATPAEAAEDVKVIFLDGFLGDGMSGEKALPSLRLRFPWACIIFIGALGSISATALKAAGVSIVLPKPWKVEELQAMARLGMVVGGQAF